MNVLTDPTQKLLTQWLGAAALRQHVIVDNMANSDTPGFVRKDVTFDAEMARASGGPAAEIEEDHTLPPRMDGNNVVVDQELAELSKNALMQQMAVQLLQAKMSMTKLAVTGKN